MRSGGVTFEFAGLAHRETGAREQATQRSRQIVHVTSTFRVKTVTIHRSTVNQDPINIVETGRSFAIVLSQKFLHMDSVMPSEVEASRLRQKPLLPPSLRSYGGTSRNEIPRQARDDTIPRFMLRNFWEKTLA